MTRPLAPHHPPAPPSLDVEDREALNDFYVRGTPENTLRACERYLIYLTAWKNVTFNDALGTVNLADPGKVVLRSSGLRCNQLSDFAPSLNGE